MKMENRYLVRDLKFKTESEATDIISSLRHLISSNGGASIGDLYDLTDVTSLYADHDYGWTDLEDAEISPFDYYNPFTETQNSVYRLKLPTPKYLSSKVKLNIAKRKEILEKAISDLDINKLTRKEILEMAKKCVCGERQEDYRTPEDNFKMIANLWTAYCGHDFSATDVAMMMSLLKIARIKTGSGTEDSFVDLAGYAACGGEILSNIKKEINNNEQK